MMKQRSFGLWKGVALAAVLGGTLLTTAAFAQQDGGQAAPPPGGGPGGGSRRGGFGGGRGGFGMMGGPVTIATVPVDAMKPGLKLTDDQVTKITAIQTQLRQDYRSAFQPPADGSQPDRQAMMQKMQSLNDKAKTSIEALLTPDQKAAEPAFLKDYQTFRNVGLPIETAGDLKLTADQKTQLTTIGDKAQKDMAAAMQSRDFSTMMQSRTDAHNKALAVLTADQKKIVDDYVAAHPQQRRGGFGGGGGGGRRGGAGGGAAGAAGA